MRDENQIAFGILRVATLTEPRPGETPAQRLTRSACIATAASVPLDVRRANGLKDAIARWGTIKERDNSPMPASRKNLDINQLAKRILDEATGDEPKTEAPPTPTKNAAAVELGRLGGKKGGVARKEALTSEQRTEIAKKAAAKRWMSKQ